MTESMMEKLEPGWLVREMESASASVVYKHSPQTCWGIGLKITAPLPSDDAARLRKKMQDRYYQWTGRDLANDLEADKSGQPANP